MNALGVASSLATSVNTAVDRVQTSIDAANASSNLNIFIEIHDKQALEAAKDIDRRISAGEPVGKLAGVPFAVKDNFLVSAGSTTAGANILKGFNSPITSTAVQKLLDEDAVLIGKTNLDAFGHGGSTESTHFGPTKNPVDPTKVPGGSSGGSAAAVAAGIVPFTLGTDTGGSIRQPSSLCGVYGIKPTYGTVSRYGVVAMASSTDCVGVMAGSAQDLSLVMSVISGRDALDGTTIDTSLGVIEPSSGDKHTFGVIKESMHGLDSDVDAAVKKAIKSLKAAGHTVKEVSIPSIDLALPCYYVIVPAEISSNLSRYDGIRYGASSTGAKDLEASYKGARSEGFLDENKRRIMMGTYVLSSGYFDAYYKKAQRLRTKLIQEFTEAMDGVDMLISPVSPSAAWPIGDKLDDPVKMYQADIMTVGASLVGIPAMSVPLSTEGLPIGLQLMARQQGDQLLMSAANQIGGLA